MAFEEPKPTSMLSLALRKIKGEKPSEEKEEVEKDNSAELEQAMTDFQNATSASDRAAAFKAALELAK